MTGRRDRYRSYKLACLAGVMLAMGTGCHRESEMIPMLDRKIAITDKFYDVQALSAERAIVVGYGGKILVTDDGGATWERVESGTRDHGLFRVVFADAMHGWIVGQDGLILHSKDAGASWQRQNSDTERYLFSAAVLDRNTVWGVGDRSTLTITTDGGKTWRAQQVQTGDEIGGGISIAAQDPVFYDVHLADANTGWISGEFGKLLHTTDGGATWSEQQQILMGNEFFDVLDLPTMFGLSFVSPREGIAVGLDARIARTEDGGATWAWQQVESPYPLLDPLFDVRVFPDGSGWAIGAAGQVVRRQPGQQVWRLAELGQPIFTWLRGISFFDELNGWLVGGYGLILRTTDGGKTWLPCFA